MKLARVKVSFPVTEITFIHKEIIIIAMVEEKSAISCNIND